MHEYYKSTIQHDSENKTEFLALDKPLPKRIWLQAFRLEKDEKGKITMINIPWNNTNLDYKRKKHNNELVSNKTEVKVESKEEMKLSTDIKITKRNDYNSIIMKKEDKSKEIVEPVKEIDKTIPKLYYDVEWVAITKATNTLMSLRRNVDYFGLLNSCSDYSKYCSLEGVSVKWDIHLSELKQIVRDEKTQLKEVLENKEVFPMSIKEKDECNEQTKQFMELIKLNSKLYKEEITEEVEGAKEIDISEFW